MEDNIDGSQSKYAKKDEKKRGTLDIFMYDIIYQLK